MAPPRKHDTDTILDAARTLALRDGPRAVSVAAIARESGAPTGTLYHRFSSRDDILAAAWLRALHRFHERWLAAERHQDPVEAGVAMARSVVAFSRDHPDDARLLIELRRRDLVDAAQQDVDNLNAPVQDSIRRLALRLFHDTGDRARDRVTRAIVDIPYATVRRHRAPFPEWLEDDVALAARALLKHKRAMKGSDPFRLY
jgi:AcrR family transcriptional regulator